MKKDEHKKLIKIYNHLSDFIFKTINGYDTIEEANLAEEKAEKALEELRNLICGKENTFETILSER